MKSENTQLCGDDFINHERRIPIKQPGFNRKYEVFIFSWLKPYDVDVLLTYKSNHP